MGRGAGAGWNSKGHEKCLEVLGASIICIETIASVHVYIYVRPRKAVYFMGDLLYVIGSSIKL